MATEILDELDITCLAAATLGAEVRQRIQFRLAAWNMFHIIQDASLVANELIVNAWTAAPESEIRVRFTREPTAVLLAVWDSSDEMPVARPVLDLDLADITADPRALEQGHDDGTGGWGLPIVEALSAECGTRKTEPTGKWVWARIPG